MRASKIQIKELYGIKEIKLEGKDYEIIGATATGKTSVLDAIRLALENKSTKGVILKKGADEGSVLIEFDTGLSIFRKERYGKASVDIIKDGKTPIVKPETFLKSLFSELQLNPVEFVGMGEPEQNRIILDLIDFKWDEEWIIKQFGELVPEIDYTQNILKVLLDIQADSGFLYRTRQEINRESRNKQAFVEEIAKDLPDKYKASDWKDISLAAKYNIIDGIREHNRRIEKAQVAIEKEESELSLLESGKKVALSDVGAVYDNSKNSLEKNLSSEIAEIDKVAMANDGDLGLEIAAGEERIKALKQELLTEEKELADNKKKKETLPEMVKKLIQDLHSQNEKDISALGGKKTASIEKIELQFKADKAMLTSTSEENLKSAAEKVKDASGLLDEVAHIETMKGHIAEYNRMSGYVVEVEQLNIKAEGYTEKIDKARTLPAEILAQSKLPLDNLTIENGKPLINGLPISNLSDGEKLELCVDVANLQKTTLNLLLIDGVEKLSSDNVKRLYAKCKEKGIQFIATRTTEDDTLKVVEL